jgi:hypothetical protein
MIHRDVAILMFLWRWKVATTKALATRFFSDVTLASAYKRLSRLEKEKFIEARCDPFGKEFVWTLSRRGFEAIKDELPRLREAGYKSEAIQHDALVTALHLGEFLTGAPQQTEVFTEQQIRRYALEEYPSWAPKTDRHRPDGYTKITAGPDGSKILAFEVELSPKSVKEYELIGDFYSRVTQVQQVIWLAKHPSLAERIRRQLVKDNFGCSNFDKHSFITLGPFKKYGWQAPVALGPRQGESLSQIIRGNTSSTASPHVDARVHLNFLKSPHRSGTKRNPPAPSAS